MTQLDAPALFHEKSFGADTTLSGLIATLAAMDALGKTDIRSLPTRILPMAFQGEFYGRLGSQMMFSDIENDACHSVREGSNPPWTSFCRSPLQADIQYRYINLTSARMTIIPDQLGQISASGSLYDYTQGDSGLGHQILQKVVDQNGLQLTERSPPNPPSPADSLLKHVDDPTIITLSYVNTPKFTHVNVFGFCTALSGFPSAALTVKTSSTLIMEGSWTIILTSIR
jgi:hypothetical protein